MKLLFSLLLLIFIDTTRAETNYLWVYMDPNKLSSNSSFFKPLIYLIKLSRLNSDKKDDNNDVKNFHSSMMDILNRNFKDQTQVKSRLSYKLLQKNSYFNEKFIDPWLETTVKFKFMSTDKISIDSPLYNKCPLEKKRFAEAIILYNLPNTENIRDSYTTKTNHPIKTKTKGFVVDSAYAKKVNRSTRNIQIKNSRITRY